MSFVPSSQSLGSDLQRDARTLQTFPWYFPGAVGAAEGPCGPCGAMGSYGKMDPEVAAATLQAIGQAVGGIFKKRPVEVQTFQAPVIQTEPESNLPSNKTLFMVGGAALGLILFSSVLRSSSFRRY